jgi:hypothetical protein
VFGKMDGGENGPLFDGVVVAIIPSEDLNLRLRGEVGIWLEDPLDVYTDARCSSRKS